MPVASRPNSRPSSAPSAPASASPCFELKNATLTLMALVLKTGDLRDLDHAFEERFGSSPPFDHDPVVIDLSALGDDVEVDFERLIVRLRALRLVAVGVEGGSEAHVEAARAAGLGETATHTPAARSGVAAPATATVDAAPSRVEPDAAPVTAEADAGPAQEEPDSAPALTASGEALASRPTVVVDRPLRSGQQVYARGADLVVLGAVNFGAEVIADGHVHVYAPLRGRAIAGARGNAAARIFSTCMEPQLVAIAGTYRTAEHALPEGIHGKPAQVRLDGQALVFTPIGG
jgi:septum site-determining protein MinC